MMYMASKFINGSPGIFNSGVYKDLYHDFFVLLLLLSWRYYSRICNLSIIRNNIEVYNMTSQRVNTIFFFV
jgi:hypothetical protein